MRHRRTRSWTSSLTTTPSTAWARTRVERPRYDAGRTSAADRRSAAAGVGAVQRGSENGSRRHAPAAVRVAVRLCDAQEVGNDRADKNRDQGAKGVRGDERVGDDTPGPAPGLA